MRIAKTLFTSFSTGTPAEYYGSSSNSFKVNINESAEMIKNSYCRFKNDAAVPASILYEPVFIALSDATLSFLPMLQPLSNKPAEIVNLGIVNSNAITAMTGAENDAGKDNDVCAVPTDWWYS